jgi:hypothetical protein
MQKARSKPTSVGVISSGELLEIARSVSKAGPRLSLEKHIQVIEARKAQETECFLLACAVRLRLKEKAERGD